MNSAIDKYVQALSCQKELFELDESVTYLNCAYMSPQMRSVTAAGMKAITRKARPYEIQVSAFFDPVRQLKENFSRLIDNDDPGRIAVIPAVSYGMANAACNAGIQKGHKIIMVDEQFPSNYYIWKKIADKAGASVEIIGTEGAENRGQIWNERILQAIGSSTRVVTLGHVHWADGTLFDLAAIRKKTKEVGALLIIDGTQSVGALPMSIAAYEPDALICAGYKFLMGPYNIGLAYYGPHFDEGEPIEDNWINRQNSQNFKELVNYQAAYQPKAARYSVGEHSNFNLVPMLNTALEQLLEWTPEAIQYYCGTLWQKIKDELIEAGFGMEDDLHRGNHLVGIRLKAGAKETSVKQLFEENKVFVSLRGDYIRVAPHVYNTQEDFEKLLSLLKKI